MRLAVIDCGTNTFNLVIIEYWDKEHYNKLFQTRVAVKLGEGAINQGYIAQAAFDRGLTALAELKAAIHAHGAEKVIAFATSAIRDAKNGVEFVNRAFTDYGISISVIDGQREADLIYFGVREAVAMDDRTSLIIDIGGGSTEFILASHQAVHWKESFRIGAARLLERFSPSDPITEPEENALRNYLLDELSPLLSAVKQHPPSELIGSSGAFDSLVEMIHGELGGEPLVDQKTEYGIDLEAYRKISQLVKRSTLAQRRQIRGLVPMRVDMIVISCIMVDVVLNALGLERLRVSTYSLKEGALVDFIQQHNQQH